MLYFCYFRQISHFLDDVPFPSPQRPHILVQLDPYEYVVLTQPEDFPIPRRLVSFIFIHTFSHLII